MAVVSPEGWTPSLSFAHLVTLASAWPSLGAEVAMEQSCGSLAAVPMLHSPEGVVMTPA